MLSKIKSTAAEARALSAAATNIKNHHHHHFEQTTQDSNNNNQNSAATDDDGDNHLDHDDDQDELQLTAGVAGGKRSQRELLEIVEESRKRRLSADSADSLIQFIKWAHSNIVDPSATKALIEATLGSAPAGLNMQKTTDVVVVDGDDEKTQLQLQDDTSQDAPLNAHVDATQNQNDDTQDGEEPPNSGSQVAADDDELMDATNDNEDDDRDWQLTQQRHSPSVELLRRHALRSAYRHQTLRDQPTAKRTRAQQAFAEQQQKSGAFLGPIVDRLHQKQQHHELVKRHQQPQQMQLAADATALDATHHSHTQSHNQNPTLNTATLHGQLQQSQHMQQQTANANLSLYLQQFLQQQTSLDELCNSVGLDDTDNNRVVIAAAIQRALIDSLVPTAAGGSGANVGGQQVGGGGGEAKSTASSTSSSSGASSGPAAHHQHHHNSHFSHSHNSLHQGGHDGNALLARHFRASTYNTAAAAAVGARALSTPSTRQAAAAAAGLGLSSGGPSRFQQQRHAQAAAALSALAASATGATTAATGAGNAHVTHAALAAQAAAVAAASSAAAAAAASASSNPNAAPVIDFTCDTCGSSFDDRHRLMQHQSIHLDLRREWFSESPVEEVMKMFSNRRRGEFICQACNLRFEATLDYDRHNHDVHGPKPYRCEFCPNGTRFFRHFRSLINHLYDHRYIYRCNLDNCDFTVNRRDSLRFHIFRFHLNCQLPQNQRPLAAGGGAKGQHHSHRAAAALAAAALGANLDHHHHHHHHHNLLLAAAAATNNNNNTNSSNQNWPPLDDTDRDDDDTDRDDDDQD